MRTILRVSASTLATLLCMSSALLAQNPAGVRLGLTYTAGTKPGILVLPVDSVGGDSIRAIVQRDLDYDDRATVVTLDAESARSLMPARGDKFNYPLFAKFSVAAIVRIQHSLTGITVSMYDVAGRRLLKTSGFRLPVESNARAWRMALHGVSDELGNWIFGARGSAQTRILYSGGDNQIWIIDSDGASARKLTSVERAMSPAWHPSGTKFAFSGFTERGTQIGIYDLKTGEMNWKSATSRGLNITPAFSPDGQTLAYANGAERGTDLMLADADDDEPARRVTVGRGSDNTSPSYSPNGRQIAFMSGRAGHPEIYTMDADGTNAQILTEFNYGEQNYRSSPDWSPDGRRITYQSRIAGDFQIMTIDLRDHSTKQYTSDGENEDPAWAPDSRHVVFSSTRSGVRQLWVADTETGRLRQLTRSPGVRLPAWSPILSGTPAPAPTAPTP